ncbi:MAG: hypothetical protein E7584_07975 [Ruminococcaceae bacterium]|nr:hypothetical protein [Oscillospiraceae bacterium]
MKGFFKNHSYDMITMLLNQIAIAMFGFTLVLAAMKIDNDALRNVTSIFSILFYLVLLYIKAWDIGFKDKISVEQGKKASNPLRGALISLCANAINYFLAIFIMLRALLPNVSFFKSIGGVAQAIAVFAQGMYTGVLVNQVGGAPLNAYWISYFIIPLPAILVCGLAYYFGLHDVKHTGFFHKNQYPESDRESKRKD